MPKFLLIVADVHRGAGKHVGRPDENREANLLDEIVNLVNCCELAPFRLVDSKAVHNAGELVAVLSLVYVLSRCSKDRDIMFVKLKGKVVRDLTSHRDNYSVRILKVNDVHHPLECQLIEVEPVTHVVVR